MVGINKLRYSIGHWKIHTDDLVYTWEQGTKQTITNNAGSSLKDSG